MIRHATNFLSDGYSGKNPTSDHSATFLIGCRPSIVNFHQHIGQWGRPTFDLIKEGRAEWVFGKPVSENQPTNLFASEGRKCGGLELHSHSLISLSLFLRLVIHSPSLPPSLSLFFLFSLFRRFRSIFPFTFPLLLCL